MAFPGTYNFSYYRGDTFEFSIYPKNSSGQTFALASYDATFTIATNRGESESQVVGYAAVSPDGTHIVCAILPSDGSELDPSQTYVYDVEIRNPDAQPYPSVYTLLTGSITVQDQVTDVPINPTQIPQPPTDLVITENPAGTVNISWTPSEVGDPATSFNIYGKAPALGITNYVLVDNTENNSYSTSSIGGFPFQSEVTYDIQIRAVNVAGENEVDTLEGQVTIA